MQTISQQIWKNHPQHHRQLICIRGGLEDRQQKIQQWLAPYGSDQGVWLGDQAPFGYLSQTEKQLSHRLGQEIDWLVVTAEQGISPNGLALACGMLRAGGICIISLPAENEHWLNSAATKLLSYPFELKDSLTGFQSHLNNTLQHFQVQPHANPPILSLPTQGQKDAITAILRCAQGHTHRPFVLTAQRGRGKSYSLGLAAFALWQAQQHRPSSDPYRIVISASRLGQTQSFWQAFQQQAKQSPLSAQFEIQTGKIETDQFELRFIPPDQLSLDRPAADLIIIDEAAQIPIPLLLDWAKHYPRIVFSSTLEGYEGSGRGFGLRFFKALDQLTPNWHQLHLQQPIRWADKDPVEAWLNQLLWLDQSILTPLSGHSNHTIHWHFSQPNQLPPAQLKQAFQLLLAAHYQTQPNDLLQLLSAPNLFLLLALVEDQVVGVLQWQPEGNLPVELFQTQERRLQGHLVAQLLYKQTGETTWLSRRSWRIQRLAVAPEWQRQGLGSQLVQKTLQQAKRNNLDWVSTSFGATEDLVDFWQKQTFKPLYLGLKRDKASATHSLVLGYPITDRLQTLCHTQQQQWAWQFAYQLPINLNQLTLDLALNILAQLPFPVASFPERLCQVQRTPFESVTWTLWHWLLGQISQVSQINQVSQTASQGQNTLPTELTPLIERLLFQRNAKLTKAQWNHQIKQLCQWQQSYQKN